MTLPTDLEIMDAIYIKYYSEFESFKKDAANNRAAKVYVPIDVNELGKKLKVDGDIIFGRLFYHFNNKYGYTNANGSKVLFFALEVGSQEREDRHCIQFPLMAAVLAELKSEQRKFAIATRLSIISLVVSVLAIIISIVL